MVAPIKPGVKLATGKETWWIVLAIANKNAPTAAEVNAATGINMSGYLFAEYAGLTVTLNKVSLPRILAETKTYQAAGETTYDMADMEFLIHPQAATGADGKKAWDKFKAGALIGFGVQRSDYVADQTASEAAAGQRVNVVPIEVHAAYPGMTSAGADGVYRATAPVSVTGEPVFDVAVAA